MLIIKPSYSLVTAINCQSDMIKTRLYNTKLICRTATRMTKDPPEK